jgi:hypothetical protein
MMATSLREMTAQFWAAASYSRRAGPDAPQHRHAQRILRRVAHNATGPLQQRAIEITKEMPDEPTCYDL